MRFVYVQPGELHWARDPCLFKTVLGSCISVCLWDEACAIGGLTHYVLPYNREADRDARFGDVAIPQLTHTLRALGCGTLVAKIFGGARVLPALDAVTVGDCNTRLAISLLQAEGIAIVAQRTGGTRGIVIEFSTADGSVTLREIPYSG